MRKLNKRSNKGLERSFKAFRTSSIIFNLLLFIGGLVIAATLIWIFIRFGEFIKIGL